MNIVIQCRDFSMTDSLKQYVENQLRFVLTRYSVHIVKINVTLLDINGPKGGLDKRCRVRLKFSKLPTIIIQDTQKNLYAAIKTCGTKLKRTVERDIKRVQLRNTAHKNNLRFLDVS